MLRSELFVKTFKDAPSDEPSANARLLTRGGFVDKLMAGVYSYLPLGWRVLKKIETIIREEMNAAGGQEINMPVLQPKENWLTTGRWESLDVLYKFETRDGREVALGPTHEEIVVPLAKKLINSYKDLPIYLYQIQTKFRDEPRAKSGLLRGREFLMKDLYSFHATTEDLDRYYEIMTDAYKRVFERCGLDAKLVEASGGTFSKYSHEFQVFTRAGEDDVFYCDCGFAQNKEIAKCKEGDTCPKCKGKIKISRAIEVGNIFRLGAKYSEPFGLKYRDEAGNEKPVLMGCYGIGLSRVMGAIVEVSRDERGIIWPDSVAPFRVIVIRLDSTNASAQKKIKAAADKLYSSLQKAGIEVICDDRSDATAGEKFADADLMGIPWRAVVSEKSLAKGGVELKRRKTGKLEIVKIDEVVNCVTS